jgi:HAD superfamily hydrolase (TIGR01509 family)
MKPIVFDCDGVLVDSETLAWAAWGDVMSSYGRPPTDAEILMFTGRSEADAYAYFSKQMPLPDAPEFSEELAVAIADRFTQSLEAYEDAEDTLHALHGLGTTMAVASSSTKRRLVLSLVATGLDAFFSVVVSADDVARGKPEPDLFLEAARQLGVEPGECVAVEDSSPGVIAAKAAGMFVVGVERHTRLEGADRRVPKLTPAALMHV